jgi:hypothetical protein
MLLCATTGLKGWSANSIIMDAPRIFHLDKLAIFLVVEGMLIAIGVISYSAHGSSTSSFCHSSKDGQRACDYRSSMQRFATQPMHDQQTRWHGGNSTGPAGGVSVPAELKAAGCRTLDYQCSVSTANSVLIGLVTASFVG